jgi:urease accessory protein
MDNDSRLMRGDKPFLFTNCKTGEGIPVLVERIRSDLLFDLRLPTGLDG